MRAVLCVLLVICLLPGIAGAAPKTHVLNFGKWTTVKWFVGPSENKPLDIPAAEDIEMPTSQLVARQDPWGGTFTELMVPYLMERKAHNAEDNPKARSALPPPLLRDSYTRE